MWYPSFSSLVAHILEKTALISSQGQTLITFYYSVIIISFLSFTVGWRNVWHPCPMPNSLYGSISLSLILMWASACPFLECCSRVVIMEEALSMLNKRAEIWKEWSLFLNWCSRVILPFIFRNTPQISSKVTRYTRPRPGAVQFPWLRQHQPHQVRSMASTVSGPSAKAQSVRESFQQ